MARSLLRSAIAASTPALALLWLACGEKYGAADGDRDAGEDAATVTDSPADAGDAAADVPVEASCDPSAPFESVTALPGTVDTSEDETYPTLTDDELAIYFQRSPVGGGTPSFYVAKRAATSVSFGDPAPVTELNNGAFNTNASITANGDSFFFSTYLMGQTTFELRVAARGPMGKFGTPTKIPALDQPGQEQAPSVFGRGEELWFITDNNDGGAYHLRRSTRLTNAFTAPEAIPELEAEGGEYAVASSRDGLAVYIGTPRTGGLGDFDVWLARRQSRNGPFLSVTLVPSASSSKIDVPGWLSVDNCRLYLTSTRLGTYDLFVATRRPTP